MCVWLLFEWQLPFFLGSHWLVRSAMPAAAPAPNRKTLKTTAADSHFIIYIIILVNKYRNPFVTFRLLRSRNAMRAAMSEWTEERQSMFLVAANKLSLVFAVIYDLYRPLTRLSVAERFNGQKPAFGGLNMDPWQHTRIGSVQLKCNWLKCKEYSLYWEFCVWSRRRSTM